jgi:plasmid maintenance system antidote protein VapI
MPTRKDIKEIDVGKMVRQRMFDKGINKARLARRMERAGQTIKQMIYRPTLQASVMWELSLALNHNFFADLAQQLDAATDGQLDKQETELEQLKAEYQRLKEERDYLRKAVDAISRDN